MKNKLNRNNLLTTYYYDGTYELHFFVDGKEVYLQNIKIKDYPKATTDEWYFYNEGVLEEIIKNATEEDIEIIESIF